MYPLHAHTVPVAVTDAVCWRCGMGCRCILGRHALQLYAAIVHSYGNVILWWEWVTGVVLVCFALYGVDDSCLLPPYTAFTRVTIRARQVMLVMDTAIVGWYTNYDALTLADACKYAAAVNVRCLCWLLLLLGCMRCVKLTAAHIVASLPPLDRTVTFADVHISPTTSERSVGSDAKLSTPLRNMLQLPQRIAASVRASTWCCATHVMKGIAVYLLLCFTALLGYDLLTTPKLAHRYPHVAFTLLMFDVVGLLGVLYVTSWLRVRVCRSVAAWLPDTMVPRSCVPTSGRLACAIITAFLASTLLLMIVSSPVMSIFIFMAVLGLNHVL